MEKENQKNTGYFFPKYNPFYSLSRYLKLRKHKLIQIEKLVKERSIQLPDNKQYKPFLRINVAHDTSKNLLIPGALFVVVFAVDKYSMNKGIKKAHKKIGFFAGLPGFQAKTYFACIDGSRFAGLYSWESVHAAERYSRSYALKNLANRSKNHDVEYKIIDLTNLNILHPYWENNYTEIRPAKKWYS